MLANASKKVSERVSESGPSEYKVSLGRFVGFAGFSPLCPFRSDGNDLASLLP